ncbi:mannose-1-phosphate guanylyltransferase [Nonlabens ponticola]|uniref:mannose-1-phosphate guanylyltransferase n=1 Tax=Nonlabens ponticola TaxID=2496866 RepID=A0A3S9MZQ4_9FLAO|nr:mannose-1-phosphate guanylyltransferase [Nonlabens ponticola]AZQ44731.1 mannose-1-phosphate guanylyltransferase [Nonlabens ponticola]
MSKKYAVIMTGGVGSRFWPVSKQDFPKQFHDMLGTGRSLIQSTYDRLIKQVPVENILILTNEDYISLVQEQLPQVLKENIVGEPAMRNTAPCILLAALKVEKKDPNAVMVVAPSDSFIGQEDKFQEDLETAFRFCDEHRDALLTLGVQPTSPNTGYGYIEYVRSDQEVKKVKQFKEKPDLDTATAYLASGNYLWNAGMFVWSVNGVVSAFAKAEPSLLQLFKQGTSCFNTAQEQDWLNDNYSQAKDVSIDYAIMERSDQVYVLPTDFGWNDLGTWSTLYQQLEKDDRKNAVVGADLLSESASGNMILTSSGKKVIIEGLEDFIVVDQNDVLMILPKNRDQEIKQIRKQAVKKYGSDIA